MIIRDAQIKILESASVDAFVAELCEHCREYAPDLLEALSDEQLDAAVRQGIKAAETHGFDKRGPVRFYVDLMIAFGSGFDTDPQYPWAAEILANPDGLGQMELADALHVKSNEAFNIVFGPDSSHSNSALEQTLGKVKEGIEFKRDNFRQGMLTLLKEIHPMKYDLVGAEGLRSLVDFAISRGDERYGFKAPRSMALMTMMMFALGHKFDLDPFHPWVSNSLKEDTGETPDKTAEKLEKRVRIWFDAVLKKAKEAK